MKVIVEIPEYVNVGILLNWCLNAYQGEKDCTIVIFKVLKENYNHVPVEMLDGLLLNEKNTLSYTGIKSVGDFFDLIGNSLKYGVFKFDVDYKPCRVLTPHGIILLNAPFMKINLITIDDTQRD